MIDNFKKRPFKPHIFQTKNTVGLMEHEVEYPICLTCLLQGVRTIYTLLKVDYKEGLKIYRCPICGEELWIEFCGTDMKGAKGNYGHK